MLNTSKVGAKSSSFDHESDSSPGAAAAAALPVAAFSLGILSVAVTVPAEPAMEVACCSGRVIGSTVVVMETVGRLSCLKSVVVGLAGEGALGAS